MIGFVVHAYYISFKCTTDLRMQKKNYLGKGKRKKGLYNKIL